MMLSAGQLTGGWSLFTKEGLAGETILTNPTDGGNMHLEISTVEEENR